jgi:hypothetical protein
VYMTAEIALVSLHLPRPYATRSHKHIIYFLYMTYRKKYGAETWRGVLAWKWRLDDLSLV